MDISQLIKRFRRFITGAQDDSGNRLAARGVAAVNAENFKQAILDLETAIELGVTEYDLDTLYTIIGRAYDGLDQTDEAIDAHRKALELNPDFHKAWNNLGIAFSHQGNLSEAMRCYQKALQINPEYPYTYGSMGVVYIKQGDSGRAIEIIKKGIALDPSIAVLHGNLALAFGMAGDYDKASQTLHQATALGYKNWQVVQNRIKNLQALEEKEISPPPEAGSRGKIPLEVEKLRISMLPTHCPGCAAMVSLSGVNWVGQLEALCPYCGVPLIRPLDD